MSRSALPFALGALLVLTGVSGCGEGELSRVSSRDLVLSSASGDPASGARTLQLAASPTTLTSGVDSPEVAEVTLRLDDPEGALFGHVGDIEELPDGRFVIVDPVAPRVSLHEASGSLVRRIGREGDGPGEYRAPWAAATSGSRVIVWQRLAQNALSVFDTGGRVLATRSRPQIDGDWEAVKSRLPYVLFDGVQGASFEEAPRRIEALPEGGFAIFLQEDDYDAGRWDRTPSDGALAAVILRFDSLGVVQDTMLRLAGSSIRKGREVEGWGPTFHHPVLGSQAHFAVGDGWIADAHGDSTRIRVSLLEGGEALTIRWNGSRTPATTEHRETWVRGWLDAQFRVRSSSLDLWESRTSAERSRLVEEYGREPWFADDLGEVGALFAGGSCLAIAGVSPGESHDGAGRTWLMVHVPRGEVLGLVRIPVEWFRIKSFSGRSFWGTTLGELGIPTVWRLENPFSAECALPSGPRDLQMTH